MHGKMVGKCGAEEAEERLEKIIQSLVAGKCCQFKDRGHESDNSRHVCA